MIFTTDVNITLILNTARKHVVLNFDCFYLKKMQILE